MKVKKMRFMIVIHNIYRWWKTRQNFLSKDFRGTKGSLSNDNGDGDGNEKGKKTIGLNWQNNNLARASRFYVHFLAVTTRLRRETS